jgi:predicted transglutaminase-like cysteine proteinase
MARRLIWFSSLVVGLLISTQVYAKDIETIFFDTYKRFHYVSDDKQYGKDTWVDWSHRIRKNRPFWGDCGDFSVTVYSLLKEEGFQPTLYVVQIPMYLWDSVKPVYHTVIRVNNKMLDNRYPEPREWDKGIKGSRYTHAVPYYEIAWKKRVISPLQQKLPSSP